MTPNEHLEALYPCLKPKPKLPKFIIPAVAVIVALILLLALSKGVRASEIPSNLWQGLIAEATSDGYNGMYAVACVVRNRLAQGREDNGLCGLKRANLGHFCAKEGHCREVMAKEIVNRIFYGNYPDITFGATHFESMRFPKPKWAYKMKETVRIGEHIFYKEVK